MGNERKCKEWDEDTFEMYWTLRYCHTIDEVIWNVNQYSHVLPLDVWDFLAEQFIVDMKPEIGAVIYDIIELNNDECQLIN